MEYKISLKATPFEMRDLLKESKKVKIVYHKNMNQSNVLLDPVKPVLYFVVLQTDDNLPISFEEGEEYTTSEFRSIINDLDE